MTIVIPINSDTTTNAERLIDWCRALNGQSGHALLAYDPDVSQEMRTRIRIAAEMAFTGIDEVIAPQKDTPNKPASATFKRNTLFLAAAEFCQKTYRGSWLLLDPISVPTNHLWLVNIENAYNEQPRRYMGTHLRPEARYLFHASVYPFNAFFDMNKIVAELPEIPFEVACGPTIIPRSSKWRLVQPLKIMDEADFEKVWPEAQIVCGDASGAYIEFLREKGVHLPKLKFQDVVNAIDELEKSGGAIPVSEFVRQQTAKLNLLEGIIPRGGDGIKIDLRTKAGRALKAAANSHETGTL